MRIQRMLTSSVAPGRGSISGSVAREPGSDHRKLVPFFTSNLLRALENLVGISRDVT